MSNNDPTKWDYFGKMKIVPFLQMCLYYQDKQRDIKRQRKEQELKNKR